MQPSKWPWLKLWGEILYDPKMFKLNDHQWRRVIEFFLIAGENGRSGELPEVDYMAWMLRTTPAELMAELEVIAATGIIDHDGDKWIVVNFDKRQARSKNAERQARFRDRLKEKEREEKEEDLYKDIEEEEEGYSNVINNVTNNVTSNVIPNDNGHGPIEDEALELKVIELMELWGDLTGRGLPPNPMDRRHDYFMPAYQLLVRCKWDIKAAFRLLNRKRDYMLQQGKTPFKLAAVVPYIVAEVDQKKPVKSTAWYETDKYKDIVKT